MSTLNPPPNAHSKGSYAQHMESTRKYLEHPCAFTKFENGHPQPPGTYCQNLHLECNFGDPRPAPQYRPKRDKYRPSCGPCCRATSPAAEYITLPESACSSARTVLILARGAIMALKMAKPHIQNTQLHQFGYCYHTMSRLLN